MHVKPVYAVLSSVVIDEFSRMRASSELCVAGHESQAPRTAVVYRFEVMEVFQILKLFRKS